eukprot:3874521-Rhodomonas_salina.9
MHVAASVVPIVLRLRLLVFDSGVPCRAANTPGRKPGQRALGSGTVLGSGTLLGSGSTNHPNQYQCSSQDQSMLASGQRGQTWYGFGMAGLAGVPGRITAHVSTALDIAPHLKDCMHPEFQCKKPQFQYSFYQKCGFFSLISGGSRVGGVATHDGLLRRSEGRKRIVFPGW